MPHRTLRSALLACAFAAPIALPVMAEDAGQKTPVPASASLSAVPHSMPPCPNCPKPINRNGGMAIINFLGPVNDKSMAALVKNAHDAVLGGADGIRINISSPGGSTTSMQFAINSLQNLPVPVETVAMSYIASAAVALYCAGEKRYMARGAALHLHQQTVMQRIMDKTADAALRSYALTSGWYDGVVRDCTADDADMSVLDYKTRDAVIDVEQATTLGMVTGKMADLQGVETWGMAINVIGSDQPHPGMYPGYDANR